MKSNYSLIGKSERFFRYAELVVIRSFILVEVIRHLFFRK